MELVHNFRLNQSSLSQSTSVTEELLVTHAFLNNVEIAFTLCLHEGRQVGVNFNSGGEGVTQTEVVLILSVFSKQYIIHLFLEFIGVGGGVVLNILFVNSLDLLVDSTCFDISLSFEHVPVVVLALEIVSARLSHSGECPELSGVTRDESGLLLRHLVRKMLFDQGVGEVQAHDGVS